MRPDALRSGRRDFLKGASAVAGLFAAGGHASGEGGEEELATSGGEGGPRLLHLELRTAAPMGEMRAFYGGTLGLPVVEEGPGRLEIAAGASRITFRGPEGVAGDGAPFYHFAFNIPENKVLAAHRWQKERTALLPIPEHLREPGYPEDVVSYRHWDAHSVFFFDPAGNVVEYIARHGLANAAPGDFGVEDILYASELAFVVDDVTAAAGALVEATGVGLYRGSSEQFAAVGDEHGLLLVMKRGRVISFEAAERKAVDVFPTRAVVRGGRPSRCALPGFPYEVSVET